MKSTVGVLALQGAFREHLDLLRRASQSICHHLPEARADTRFNFREVRTQDQLSECDALIIPGGESTTISLVAARCNLLEPLRDFVKRHRKPTWGTCAGLILLAESANRTKRGGQELIGGLDVRVNRNHFGRQVESFVTDLNLPFLDDLDGCFLDDSTLFQCIFIRAPIVEKILPYVEGEQKGERSREDTVIAPSRTVENIEARKAISREVEVLARLPASNIDAELESGNIVAVRQGNVFGTSFHPELTGDVRIHVWWLRQLMQSTREARNQSTKEDGQ